MKNIVKSLMLASAMVLGLSSQASHNQGMNIAYEYLGGDSFEFTVDFWRYCGGSAFNNGTATSAAGAGTSIGMYIYCPDVAFQQSFTLLEDTFFDVSPICAAQSYLSSCPPNGSWNTGLLGIEWHIYKGVVHFDQLNVNSCSEWVFWTDLCCRNSGTNYSSQPGLISYAKMRMDDFYTNSSPQFSTPKPIPFFCNGQYVVYNWGAVELDGDSLHWELDTAISSFSAGNVSAYVTYNAGYEGTEPIPGITIDSLTGQLEFTATIPSGYNFANYAVAVRVDEYDAELGLYKGSVHRDVQFIVLDSCDNNPPAQDPQGITNFVGSGALMDSNTVEVCFGQSFEFDIIYYDYDSSGNLSNDSMSVSCNITDFLPTAEWTHSGTNPDTVTISWDAVPTPLTFVPFNITIEDDFCPVTGFNIYSYVIRIVPSTFLGPDTSMCESDTLTLNANGGDTFYWDVIPNPDGSMGDPIDVGVNFGCDICQEPWIHPSTTTTYVATSNLSATCGNSDTITVTVFEKYPINIDPLHGGTAAEFVYCANDPLDTLQVDFPIGTFIGSGIVNAIDGVFAADVLDPGVGNDTSVQIIYVIEGLCESYDTATIRIKGLPDATITTVGPYCEQLNSVQLAGNLSGGNWTSATAGNPTTAGIFNPSAFSAPDTVMVYHQLNDSGCVNTDSAAINITSEYSSKIDSLPRICDGESVLIHLNNYEGDPYGTWSGNDVYEEPIGSGNFYINTSGKRAGSYNITYSIPGECGTTTTEPLVINPLPDARIFGADSVYCDNIDDSIQLTPAVEGGIWGGSLVEQHDGYFVPSRLGEGLYTISYELYDTLTTCYNKNVVNVRIARQPVRPDVHGGGPYCQGTHVSDIRGDGLLSNTYKWYGYDYQSDDTLFLGAGNPFDFGAVVDMPTILYGTQVSEYGCESELNQLIIEVLPAPSASFIADTLSGNVPFEVTFTNTSEAINDTNNVALYYEWNIGGFVTDTAKHQRYTFEEIGFHTVTLNVSNTRCSDSASVVVVADRLYEFFIPNVFTPNGDNENDLLTWKVDGLQEFRIVIFNRWGTRVFITEDPTEFWNGGDESEGVYYYVVTAKQSSLEEQDIEYRGDVTLIRD